VHPPLVQPGVFGRAAIWHGADAKVSEAFSADREHSSRHFQLR
jgi:hypothetical protein